MVERSSGRNIGRKRTSSDEREATRTNKGHSNALMLIIAVSALLVGAAAIISWHDDTIDLDAADDGIGTSFTDGKLNYKVTKIGTSNEVQVIGYVDAPTGDMIIPDVVKNPNTLTEFLVTSIGNMAFEGCTKLTSINLSSVISIDSWVFNGCTGLTSINLSSVTSIGYGMFSGCTGLTSINLSSVTSVSNYAFSQCTGLTSINLSSVTSVSNYAFKDCTNLAVATMPSGVQFEAGAFPSSTILLLIDDERLDVSAYMNVSGDVIMTVTAKEGQAITDNTTGVTYASGPAALAVTSSGNDWMFKPVEGVKMYTVFKAWNIVFSAAEGGQLEYKVGTGDFVSVPEEGKITVRDGSKLVVRAVPAMGYRFTSWSVSSSSETTFTIESVNANASVSASFSLIKYEVTFSGTNATRTDTNGGTATFGTDFTVAFDVNTHYNRPASVTVSVGGSAILNGYVYSQADGTIIIDGSAITGDISVTVVAVPQTFGVTFNGTNVTTSDITGSTKATYGEVFEFTMAASAAHSLPGTVMITANGIGLIGGSDYDYDNITGTVSIHADRIVGPIVITIKAVLGTVTLSGDGTVTFTFTADSAAALVGDDENVVIDASSYVGAKTIVLDGTSVKNLMDAIKSSANASTVTFKTSSSIVTVKVSDLPDSDGPYDQLSVTVTASSHALASDGEIVFKISVTYGYTPLTSFEGGLSISIVHVIGEGQDSGRVRMWHVVSNGGADERVAVTCAHADGTVTFATDSLSYFIVGYEAAVDDPAPADDDGFWNTTNIIVVAAAGVLAVIALLYVFVIRK